jgi:hypothetical protein
MFDTFKKYQPGQLYPIKEAIIPYFDLLRGLSYLVGSIYITYILWTESSQFMYCTYNSSMILRLLGIVFLIGVIGLAGFLMLGAVDALYSSYVCYWNYNGRLRRTVLRYIDECFGHNLYIPYKELYRTPDNHTIIIVRKEQSFASSQYTIKVSDWETDNKNSKLKLLKELGGNIIVQANVYITGTSNDQTIVIDWVAMIDNK